jgi:hypothetical protein
MKNHLKNQHKSQINLKLIKNQQLATKILRAKNATKRPSVVNTLWSRRFALRFASRFAPARQKRAGWEVDLRGTKNREAASLGRAALPYGRCLPRVRGAGYR